MMTQLETEWLEQKRMELNRAYQDFGVQTAGWDLAMFLRIVQALQRENRRLRTQLGAKV